MFGITLSYLILTYRAALIIWPKKLHVLKYQVDKNVMPLKISESCIFKYIVT